MAAHRLDWLLACEDTVAEAENDRADRDARSAPDASGRRELRINYRELESGG